MGLQLTLCSMFALPGETAWFTMTSAGCIKLTMADTYCDDKTWTSGAMCYPPGIAEMKSTAIWQLEHLQ